MHIAQIVLVTAVIGLSAARLLMPNAPRGRSTTMGLGMGAKSLVIFFHQLLTEHVDRLRKWGSLKTYAILSSLEVVFWGAILAKYTVVISIMDWYHFRRHSAHCGLIISGQRGDSESMSTLETDRK
ncbi:hypothetical protein QQZ08_008537 [Neonectria magnoliae]|uniref:Uncharacterized protein n=1 Tax=Neonectria magnoliae TaxID=2732573 RepID=A0ABR1HUY8_9HYPO